MGLAARQCAETSGCRWDDNGNPTKDSPYQGDMPQAPPAHIGCRCSWLPVLRSYDEIMGRKGDRLKALPEGTRASMDGQVAETTTYEQWLKGKTKGQQNEALGPGKADLWRAGKITSLSELVDQSGRPISLTRLQAQP